MMYLPTVPTLLSPYIYGTLGRFFSTSKCCLENKLLLTIEVLLIMCIKYFFYYVLLLCCNFKVGNVAPMKVSVVSFFGNMQSE